MIVVTGGAGFIGSNLIGSLNKRGIEDIVLVDDLTRVEKIKNINNLSVNDFLNKHEFLSAIKSNLLTHVDTVFHLGACSDTMVTDGHYVMENNFTYSKAVYDFCQQHSTQYIYASSASVYGANTLFAEESGNEEPLNAYAYSKFLFDRYVRSKSVSSTSQVVGLRYFNVYGYNEQHKPKMASVAYHFYHQYRDFGKVKLFEGSGGYGNGEQRRDFVFVEDVVDTNLFFMDNPDKSGIFNVGTGSCSSFNDVAVSVVNTLSDKKGIKPRTLLELVQDGEIEYIPMPATLHGKYQSYTEADVTNLRATGYDNYFSNVAEGTSKYVNWLFKGDTDYHSS